MGKDFAPLAISQIVRVIPLVKEMENWFPVKFLTGQARVTGAVNPEREPAVAPGRNVNLWPVRVDLIGDPLDGFLLPLTRRQCVLLNDGQQHVRPLINRERQETREGNV